MSENEEVQEIFPVRMSTKGNTFDKDYTKPAPVDVPKESSAPAPAIDSEQPPKQTETEDLPPAESIQPQSEKSEESETTSTSDPSPTSPPRPPAPPVSAAKASKSKSAEA